MSLTPNRVNLSGVIDTLQSKSLRCQAQRYLFTSTVCPQFSHHCLFEPSQSIRISGNLKFIMSNHESNKETTVCIYCMMYLQLQIYVLNILHYIIMRSELCCQTCHHLVRCLGWGEEGCNSETITSLPFYNVDNFACPPTNSKTNFCI